MLSSLIELVIFSDQRVSSSLCPKEYSRVKIRFEPASSNQLLVMRRSMTTVVQLQSSLSEHVCVGQFGSGASALVMGSALLVGTEGTTKRDSPSVGTVVGTASNDKRRQVHFAVQKHYIFCYR